MTEFSLQEMADRLAIRDLIDHYAYYADQADPQAQAALFTEDTDYVVYMDAKSATPTQTVKGRANLLIRQLNIEMFMQHTSPSDL